MPQKIRVHKYSTHIGIQLRTVRRKEKHWPQWLIDNMAHKFLAPPLPPLLSHPVAAAAAYATANWLQYNKVQRSECWEQNKKVQIQIQLQIPSVA